MINNMEASEERVEYLRSRIVEAFQSEEEDKNIGNLALEIILLRNEYEDAKDESSKKILKELRDLEKTLISLYMMGKLDVPDLKEYKSRNYRIFHKNRP